MFDTCREGDVFVVMITQNKLDSEVAADFQEEFSLLIEKEKGTILLDLENVTFMDSSGLAAFVYCFKLTDIKEDLAICNVQERVMHLFRLTRMNRMVQVFDSRDLALSELSHHPG